MDKMKVGFLTNKLTLRGTEIALYDYADFNETILGNESVILTRSFESVRNGFDVSLGAYLKFKKRFNKMFYYDKTSMDEIIVNEKIDVLYIIKSGNRSDGIVTNKCKCVIHCVFELNDKHGDVYVAISQNLNHIWYTNYPVVPHMIRVVNTNENLRESLNIPITNLVFGRYGGRESFDINFVKEVVVRVANENPNYTFLFMNTYPFCQMKNVIFVDGTDNMNRKRMFINTCDAMIHARERGETFGLSCGEFAVCGKPVITYGLSKERNHLDILGDKAILYQNREDLYDILKGFEKDKYHMEGNGYLDYSPENVMKVFQKVFLD
jgi:hypothetical protein